MSSKTSVLRKKKTFVQILHTPGVAGYIFILPFIIGFVAFLALPMILSFGFSFTRYNILESPVFVGLENYKTMFFFFF